MLLESRGKFLPHLRRQLRHGSKGKSLVAPQARFSIKSPRLLLPRSSIKLAAPNFRGAESATVARRFAQSTIIRSMRQLRSTTIDSLLRRFRINSDSALSTWGFPSSDAAVLLRCSEYEMFNFGGSARRMINFARCIVEIPRVCRSVRADPRESHSRGGRLA